MNLHWTINPQWRFRSITGYRESDSENSIDFDTTPGKIADVAATYSDNQTTQEFQLLHDSGDKVSGILGVYYLQGEAGGVVKNICLAYEPESAVGEYTVVHVGFAISRVFRRPIDYGS